MGERDDLTNERPPQPTHPWVHRAIFVGGLVVFVILLVALFFACNAALHVP
jgi:hypothetical protein